MSHLLKNDFNPTVTVPKLTLLKNKIQSEMPDQILRWRSHQSVSEWEEQCKLIEVFLKERHSHLLENFKSEAGFIR
jgi:hypothetical protein